jgi:hypothetical protein
LDPLALERSGLEQDVAGRLGDLGQLAAHHAGDRDRPFHVTDQQVVRRERPLDAVERHEPLPFLGPTHDDTRALEQGEVERVERLADLEHRVVRRVDRR